MLYGVYWSVPFVPAITNISQIIDVLAEVRERIEFDLISSGSASESPAAELTLFANTSNI